MIWLLVCPVCDAAHEPHERFCADCGVPLTFVKDTTSESTRRARKVKPGYADGPLVRVATARHQAEAEMIQNLLLEEGIPSLARRTGGFDVPDFLAAGPRDIVVAASAEETAREILGDRREDEPHTGAAPAPHVDSRASGDAVGAHARGVREQCPAALHLAGPGESATPPRCGAGSAGRPLPARGSARPGAGPGRA